ncbi:MAG TPA: hypothetical protein VFE98_10025 [Candidatus Bathyarchaeia archaeon]|nr:hypothetical protein [Candidatus Bathyarchaeia archaeon]
MGSFGLIASAVIMLTFLALPVHAQPPTFTATDRSAYVPGDSGTLTFTITNTGNQGLEIRNVTIYYPWAGYGPDGKYQGNSTINYYPYKTVTSATGGAATFSDKATFTIPGWYSQYGVVPTRSGICPDTTRTRYDATYGSCVLIGGGQSGYGAAYTGSAFTVNMALPTYTPVSLVSMTIPILTLVVLVVVVAVLVMVWSSVNRLRRDMKK